MLSDAHTTIMGDFTRLETMGLELAPTQRVIKAAVYQKWLNAEELLTHTQKECLAREEQARDQAARIIDEAHQEADKIINTAKKQMNEWLEKERSRLGDELEAQKTQDLVEWSKEIKRYFENTESAMTDTILKCCEQIIGNLDPESLTRHHIREALTLLSDRSQITIHVAPSVKKDLLDLEEENILRIVSDSRLKPGDCLIQTPDGVIEANLEKQLSILRRQVHSYLASTDSAP